MVVDDDEPLTDVGWLTVGVVLGVLLSFAAAATQVPALASVGVTGDTDAKEIDGSKLNIPEDVRRLHDSGITGSNVTVGILDATGFDTDHPTLRDQVVASRTFGPANSVRNGGVNAHGTAAAVTVAAIAPDADLLLANADSPRAALQALQWFADRDIDVVVVQFSRLGAPGDGTAPLSRAMTRLREGGTVVVVPTGNLARGHWHGRFRPGADGNHTFADGSRNELQPLGPGTSVVRGRASLWLTWRGEVDLALDLYRVTPTGLEHIATSERVRDRDSDATTEGIRKRLEPGMHIVVFRPGDGVTPSRARGVPITLQSPTHAFAQATPAGSVAAPATARDVLAVGGYDRSTGTVTLYSGRGPTTDGRRAVDVVAPVELWTQWPGTGSAGTSVAAAYAGGTAALMLEADPSLGPASLETALTSSATPLGLEPGPTAGHGRLTASDAVGRVSPTVYGNATNSSPSRVTQSAVLGNARSTVVAATPVVLVCLGYGLRLRRFEKK